MGEVFAVPVTLPGQPAVDMNILAITQQDNLLSVRDPASMRNARCMHERLCVSVRRDRRRPVRHAVCGLILTQSGAAAQPLPCIADDDYSFNENGILGFGPIASGELNEDTVRCLVAASRSKPEDDAWFVPGMYGGSDSLDLTTAQHPVARVQRKVVIPSRRAPSAAGLPTQPRKPSTNLRPCS